MRFGAIIAVSIFLAVSFSSFPALAQSDDPVSANFRGEITYSGSYDGQLTPPLGFPQRLRAREYPGLVHRQSNPMGGDFIITVVYEGNAIRGSVRTTGRLPPSTFFGRREGDTCHIVFQSGELVAHCGMHSLYGDYDAVNSQNTRVQFSVQTSQTQLVDYAQRDRENAVAVAAAAENQKKLQATRSRNDRIAYGDGPIADRLDAIVEIDSRSWLAWRYEPGSMTNVQKSDIRGKHEFTVSGDFQYASGDGGHVIARVSGGRFQCLQFSNEPSCRPIGHPPSHDVAGAFLNALVSGGGNSGPPGEERNDEGLTRQQQNDINGEYIRQQNNPQ